MFPHVLAYSPPTVATVTVVGSQFMSSNGGQVVELSGTSFGPAHVPRTIDFVRYESLTSTLVYHATNCSVSVAHLKIRCLTSPGVGSDFVWLVSVGGQLSQSAVTFYARPTISSLAILNATTRLPVGTMATRGGDIVHIEGDNLGTLAFLSSVTYTTTSEGEAGGEADGASDGNDGNSGRGGGGNDNNADNGVVSAATLTAVACRFVDAHHVVECLTQPGSGTDFRFSLTTAHQRAEFPQPFHYSPPVVVSVSPSHVPTSGGVTVTVTGRHFGVSAAAVSVVIQSTGVTLSGSAGLVKLVAPDTTLSFPSPAIKSYSVWLRVIVGGQATQAFELVAAPPVVFGTQVVTRVIHDADHNTTRVATALVVQGVNFGSPASTSISVVTWDDIDAVDSGGGEDVGGSGGGGGGGGGSSPESMAVLLRAGGTPSRSHGVANLTRSLCLTDTVTDAQLECFMTSTRGVLQVQVFARRLYIPFDMLEMVRKPVVESIEPSVVPTDGATVVLHGTTFRTSGAVWMQQYVTEDGGESVPVEGTTSSCDVVSWADTRVECAVPPGVGVGFRFVVVSAWITGLPSPAIRYDWKRGVRLAKRDGGV